MGLFGKNDDKQRDNEALAAEVTRLDGLPYEALAAEVLERAFGPGAPGHEAGLQPHEIVAAINPSTRIFGMDAEAEAALADLVHEGLHVLYRAGLVRWSFSGGDHASMTWELSRAGARAIQQGSVGTALDGAGPRVS